MNHLVTRIAQLIRFCLWLLVLGAFIAAVWLVYEAYTLTQTMPDQGWNFHVIRIVGLVLVNLAFSSLLAVAVVMYLWGKMASSLPDLKGWHTDRPESEFCEADAEPGYTLDDYIAQEDKVFAELDALIDGPWSDHSSGAYSRFHSTSVCNPKLIGDRNWNRSCVLEAENPIGGVLLLHGLSDSPYSLRALGQRLHSEGYTVVWLRLPGHGTSPSALANVSYEDWTAAVRVAVKSLRKMLPDGVPLVLGGYSNGGALSVHYTLSAIKKATLPKPDAIVLFSPMIGINPMARLTRLYHMVALVFRNQKAQWSSIEAEIDPYKFSSWPMNASVQAWIVTQLVEGKLKSIHKAGRMNEMPPILTMQSVVDSTVVVPKLITVLFDRLKQNSNELFLFDINREAKFSNLFNLSFEKTIVPKLEKTDLPFSLSVMRNVKKDSHEMVVYTREGSSWNETPTGVAWPDGVVSLSHVALPIPPDDSVYGAGDDASSNGLSLGTLNMRAEPSALLISNTLFVRCRNNPFYSFMEDRVVSWMSETVVSLQHIPDDADRNSG